MMIQLRVIGWSTPLIGLSFQAGFAEAKSMFVVPRRQYSVCIAVGEYVFGRSDRVSFTRS